MFFNFKKRYEESPQINDNDEQKFLDLILAKGMERLQDLIAALSSAKYQEQLKELEKRYNDPVLKLAVIGDFNTGKSTFINALLKKSLLSTDNVPTTVIPTYMRWDGVGGSAPLMKISLVGDEKEYTIQEHRALLEKRLKIKLLQNQDENIERISTNNDLVGIVSHISISFPKDERYKHFCLIDTPGVNPGAEETREHANITREVLRKEADATIILFPSHTVGQRSALEYISENASHLLDGASFVITKIDMVEGEKEEAKLPLLLKGLVKQNFDLDISKVYTCSARYALAFYNGKVDSPKYAQQFDEMINDIFDNLNRKRKQIIYKKMMELMSLLLGELKSEFSVLSTRLHQKMNILEKYSLDMLKKEYNSMYDRYYTNLIFKHKAVESQIHSQAIALKNNCMKMVEENTATGIFALRKYASEGVKDDISVFEKSNLSSIESDITEIGEEYTDFSKNVFECLKKYQLQVDKQISSTIHVDESAFSPSVNIDVSIDGLLLDFGIGAVIFLFLNPSFFIVPAFFSVGAALAKDRVRNQISEGLNSTLPSIEQKWGDAIDFAKDKYVSSGKELMEQYQSEYAMLFESKKKIYLEEKKELEDGILAVRYKLYHIKVIETALKVPFKLDTYTECNDLLLKKALSGKCGAMKKIGSTYKHSDKQKSLDWYACELLVRGGRGHDH